MKILALVLAGGRGERMGILCYVRPKSTLPFAGRSRIIDFPLSNCINSGITNIAALTDYQRFSMGKYLSEWTTVGSKLESLHILEPGNHSYRSTADAICQNLDYLEASQPDSVLVLPSDHVYLMDYRPMLALHELAKADLTIAVTSVPIEEAVRFGNILVTAEGRVTHYIEKPDIPQSSLVSMGIFLFNRQVLTERLVEDSNKTGSNHGFERAIIPRMLNENGRVFAYKFDGYWRDVGTVDAYYRTNMESVGIKLPLGTNSSWPIFTVEEYSPPPIILREGIIRNSIVGPGCVIEGQVINSILSPGSLVEEQAVVKDSVLMRNVSIGYNSIIDGCIVDEEVDIGRHCYIGFAETLIHGECDITVVGKGATVQPHTAIGRNCTIMPHAPDEVVSSGSIASPRSPAKREVAV